MAYIGTRYMAFNANITLSDDEQTITVTELQAFVDNNTITQEQYNAIVGKDDDD